MAAKSIDVSSDNGVTWYTLPGNTGEMSFESNLVEDTIFGQNFQSQFPGIINWTVSANAIYKGIAGYKAVIKKAGTGTPVVNGAMTLVSGKTYQVTTASQQVWDRTATVTVKDNAVTVSAANIANIDYLFGKVTFAASYTVIGPVTVDYTWLAMTQIAKARSYNLTMSMDPIANTDYETAQANSGIETFIAGLKTVEIELGGVFATTNAWRAALLARTEMVIEINPDGLGFASGSVARGFFVPATVAQSGGVGELEEETINFSLQVPTTSLLYRPFSWNHATASSIGNAIKTVLNAWEGDINLDIRYLGDGTNGFKGDAYVSECSLAGTLEGLNEFSFSFQGTTSVTAVP